jgi:hypothetical protein
MMPSTGIHVDNAEVLAVITGMAATLDLGEQTDAATARAIAGLLEASLRCLLAVEALLDGTP